MDEFVEHNETISNQNLFIDTRNNANDSLVERKLTHAISKKKSLISDCQEHPTKWAFHLVFVCLMLYRGVWMRYDRINTICIDTRENAHFRSFRQEIDQAHE